MTAKGGDIESALAHPARRLLITGLIWKAAETLGDFPIRAVSEAESRELIPLNLSRRGQVREMRGLPEEPEGLSVA